MTRVDSFEDLIVILMKDNQVKVVHGSINNSQPGVWQSRESANILIVDCNVKPAFKWQDEIVDGSGRTLREYRRDVAVWEAQQAEEPEVTEEQLIAVALKANPNLKVYRAVEKSLEAGGRLVSEDPLVVIRDL